MSETTGELIGNDLFDKSYRPYEPRGAASDLFYCQADEILIEGPAGTGKTRAVLEKAHLICQEVSGVRVLLVRKTRSSMTQSVLITFESKVLPENDPLCRGVDRAHRQSYKYPNGSELVLGGLDNVDRIMSSEYDVICVFEATEIAEDDWEKLLTRMRNHVLDYQQAIADCNPVAPVHWLNQRAEKGKMVRLLSRHIDNPAVTPEYLTLLSRLTGHRRDRLYLGKWVAAEGLVYPELESCFIEPMSELPDGAFRGAIDFGFNDPFVGIGAVLYDDEDGRDVLYLFYERYKSKCSLAVHAEALKAVAPGPWFADPSRPDSINDLRRADLIVRPARNSILAGIDAVNARIASGKLLISSACIAIRTEGHSYRYPQNGIGEKPIGEFDHACFPAGTMIASPQGHLPIQHVKPGDILISHDGFCTVDIAEQLGPSCLLCLTLSNGTELRCTAEHPLALASGGWIAARDSLGATVAIRSEICGSLNRSLPMEHGCRSSSTKANDTAAILPRSATLTSHISSIAALTFTALSGASITAKSRLGTKSTIAMETLRTTESKILNASTGPSTFNGNTNGAEVPNSLPPSESRRLNGTAAKKGEHGIVDTQRGSRPTCRYGRSNANGVENPSTQRTGRGPRDFVPALVGTMPERRPVPTMRIAAALCAEPSSLLTVTRRRNAVRQNVQSVFVRRIRRLAGRQPVYNLATTSGTYFANGVLVSNCDALRYLVMGVDARKLAISGDR